MRNWVAGLSMAVAAAAGALPATQAQDCTAAAPCAASAGPHAATPQAAGRWLGLAGAADSGSRSYGAPSSTDLAAAEVANLSGAASRPVAFHGGAPAQVALAGGVAPAGVVVLGTADDPLEPPASAGPGLPRSLDGTPASSFAWLFALAFLGMIVLRRTRSASAF